ncbi:hypothetical protein [Reichenbachiella sp.]|uniref:hypothetical protein n=1 Tax=Reichenbachiella sp. TaxID=2184521 RepID=UPI00329A0778
MSFTELNSVEHYIIHQLTGLNLSHQDMTFKKSIIKESKISQLKSLAEEVIIRVSRR